MIPFVSAPRLLRRLVADTHGGALAYRLPQCSLRSQCGRRHATLNAAVLRALSRPVAAAAPPKAVSARGSAVCRLRLRLRRQSAKPPAGFFVGYRSPVLSGYRLPCSSVVSSLPFLDQRLFGLCLFRAAARFITLSAEGLRLSAHWPRGSAANHLLAACVLFTKVRLRPSLRSVAAPRPRCALVGRALPSVARPSPRAHLCYALPTSRLSARALHSVPGDACDKWHAELLSRCSGPS